MAVLDREELNVASVAHGKLTWFYMEKPSAKEVDFLAQHFHFHPLDLEDLLSRIQRPKIDEYDDYLFIVLHFPVFDKENRITRPSEVDIFVGENYVVTVHCSADLKPLAKFFQQCQTSEKSRETYLGRSSGFLLYHILDRLVDYCFPILNKVTQNIEDVEDIIFTKTIPDTVKEISLIRRDLISFRRVIRPQLAVIETMEREEYPFFKEDQEVYFGNVADHIRKIWDALEDCKEVIDGFYDTSNWLTSHRLQETMRILTIIMGVMAPPTLIASIYGMNVGLPGGNSANPNLLPFGILLLVMTFISLGLWLYLRHRRWI